MVIGETLALCSSKTLIPKHLIYSSRPFRSRYACNTWSPPSSSSSPVIGISQDQRRMVESFNPRIPLQEGLTPPSSWYTDPSFLALELEHVFFRGWQAVGYFLNPKYRYSATCRTISKEVRTGMKEVIKRVLTDVSEQVHAINQMEHYNAGLGSFGDVTTRNAILTTPPGFIEQIEMPYDFFTGRLGNVEFVICRDANGDLRAFHNVCRHHASLLASGSGQKSCFVCPYHGWTYGLDGVLLKATRITGIQSFNKDEFGLIPLNVATWGPFVLISLEKDILPRKIADNEIVENEWLGSASEILSTNGIDSSLKHVCRREYTIECNWKVFCDNYLDGGYHVPYAHGGLASGLKLDSYSTQIFEKVSIQRCESGSVERDDFDRLGSKALYAFIYPNFMVNRYGPWMDTNLVLPLSSTKCQVIFDYFLDASLLDDKLFMKRSLEESERVQMEDIALCEGVQKGLQSPAYCSGRYAPTVEKAMHHFHCLLHGSLNVVCSC